MKDDGKTKQKAKPRGNKESYKVRLRNPPSHQKDLSWGFSRKYEYKSEMCDILVERMGLGYSVMATAGYLGIPRSILYQWRDKYDEFKDAMEVGMCKRSYFLEGKGLAAASGPSVTYALAALKNCNRDDFRDQTDVTQTAKIEVIETRFIDAPNGGGDA